MSTQVRSHSAIARELWRIRRRRRQPIDPGYLAIVAKAHELGLPKRVATDITLLDRRLIIQRQPRQFAWLLHERGSLLSLPEPNQRPLDYLYAARRMFGQALPFWWDGSELIRAEHIDDLMERMAAACADLERKARELL